MRLGLEPLALRLREGFLQLLHITRERGALAQQFLRALLVTCHLRVPPPHGVRRSNRYGVAASRGFHRELGRILLRLAALRDVERR